MADNTYIFFLGRHTNLSFEELRAACRMQKLPNPMLFGSIATLTSSKTLPDNFIDQLGGTDRVASVLQSFAQFPTAEEVVGALPYSGEKVMIGFSTLNVPPPPLKRFATDVKKAARSQGTKLKFVIPAANHSQLNSAQVAFNKLDQEPNSELTFLKHEESILMTRTIQIQDIVAYEKRDTGKPSRDPKAGMLPPKLAQIMLNIAVGHLPDTLQTKPISILDPFCGSGVVLQEGWLTDHKMFGSDANLEAIESSKKNLAWLTKTFQVDEVLAPELLARDVTNTFPSEWKQSFSAVVTEPYLGPPVKNPLPPSLANKRVADLAALYRLALKNTHSLLKTDGVVAFLFPVFFTQDGWVVFPDKIIDGMAQIGYRVIQLSQGKRGLVYKRPDALVGRELILFQKI